MNKLRDFIHIQMWWIGEYQFSTQKNRNLR